MTEATGPLDPHGAAGGPGPSAPDAPDPPHFASGLDDTDKRGGWIDPLPGELGITDLSQSAPLRVSVKAVVAVITVVLGLIGVSAGAIFHYFAPAQRAEGSGSPKAADRPAAAGAQPRRLDLGSPVPAAPTIPAISASGSRLSANASVGDTRIPGQIPALIPTAQEADPIGVHRSGDAAQGAGSGSKVSRPEDAPVMIVSIRPAPAMTLKEAQPTTAKQSNVEPGPSGAADEDPLQATTRNLQAYQRQLQGMLETLSHNAALAASQQDAANLTSPTPTSLQLPSPGTSAQASSPPAQANAGGGLFGGQLQGSATPKVYAAHMGNLSLILPKDTVITCALTTKIVSAVSGLVGCQTLRHTYSADGRVLLLERGSRLDGEYRITSVKPGTVRIPVLWTRVRTPLGIEVPLESPGIGQLGESGVDGYVDNRWGERLGAAMLLSLIDDSVQMVIRSQTESSDSGTVVLSNTSSNTSKLAEKVLDSTINIPPLIYQNQARIVGVYVARDIDFSKVYELRAAP